MNIFHRLQSVKKLTARKMLKAVTTRLGKTLLDVPKENLIKQAMKVKE
jgi:hypothetical protein